MEENTAKKASELLKRKSELVEDLSKLCEGSEYNLWLSYSQKSTYIFSHNPWRLNIDSDKEVNEEIRKLLQIRVNEKISKIDEELKNLSC